MDNEKVYTPIEIADTPFPVDQNVNAIDNQSIPGVVTAKPIQNQPFPPKKVAHAVVGESLNTQSKKILAEYQFAASGALQIGEFQQDKSGDLRISPAGIVARNLKGDATFTLDADTGDAAFKGTVLAGDVEVIDGEGLVSLSAFTSDSVSIDNANDITSTPGNTDIAGASLSFSLGRDVNVLIFVNIQTYASNLQSNSIVTGLYKLDIDGVTAGNIALIFSDGEIYTPGTTQTLTRVFSLSGQQITKLAAGSHVLKIVASVQAAHSEILKTLNATLTYIILGR